MLDDVPLVWLCIAEDNLEPRKVVRFIEIWLPDSLSREIYYWRTRISRSGGVEARK
jgi:hypothetical protein